MHEPELAGNELVVDGRGNAYVNGGGFNMMAGEPYAPGGVVLVTTDATARQVADELAFPNGMAVTANNKTLIVGESYAKQLTAYEITDDGSLGNRRVWAELGDGVPDGICIDAEGTVWYADVPNKRCVRVREGGDVLDTVDLDRAVSPARSAAPTDRPSTSSRPSGTDPKTCSRAREPDSYSPSQRPRQQQAGQAVNDGASHREGVSNAF
jgi:sugar lactone lactonase YvrE